jgi:hypothetical protein
MGAKPENVAASKDVLQKRADMGAERAGRGLDTVSPKQVDPATAGRNLKEAALAKITGDVAKRTTRVEKGYDTIAKGGHTIQAEPGSAIAQRLAEPDSVLNGYIGKVRRGTGRDRLRGKTDDSFEILNEVKKEIDHDIQHFDQISLTDRKAAWSERDLIIAKNELVDEMKKQVPGYETVLKRYAKMSPEIDRMQSSHMGRFAQTQDTSLSFLPGQLSRLTPAQLAQMRKDLGKKGTTLLRENIRAHLDDLAASDTTGNKVMTFLTKGTKAYNRLKTVMGEDELDKLYRFFDNERRMANTTKQIAGGSATAPRLEGTKSLEADMVPELAFAEGLKKKGIYGTARDYLIDSFMGAPTEKKKELYGRTAKELFSTGRGAQRLIDAILAERLRTAPAQEAVRARTAEAIPAMDSVLLDYFMNQKRR